MSGLVQPQFEAGDRVRIESGENPTNTLGSWLRSEIHRSDSAKSM